MHARHGSWMVLAAGVLMASSPQPARFDRTAWLQDYAALKSNLERSYSNLAWKASFEGGVDLPALDRAAAEALRHARNDAEAGDAIRRFIAGFHDGHLSEAPYLAPAQGVDTSEPAPATLRSDDPVGGCAALGQAASAPVIFSLPFEQLPGFDLVSDGLGTTFRTGTAEPKPGVRIGLIRIQAFRARAFPAACLHAWADLAGAGTPITAAAVRDAARLRWFADLAAAIGALRRRGAAALVVDVGNNGGGDDSGDWAVRLFSDRPVRSARLLLADAPSAAGYLDEQISGLRERLAGLSERAGSTALQQALERFLAQKARIGQQGCDMAWVWRERRHWSPGACNRLLEAGFADGFDAGLPRGAYGDRKIAAALSWASTVEDWFGAWTGPTYVVADGRSYSSAEMFVAAMQDNRVARIVGMRTGGDGCGFMSDSAPLVLPHSRLRFRIPNCMRLRADGSNEEAGVAPDLPVLRIEGESDRARARRTLEVIAADMSRTPR